MSEETNVEEIVFLDTIEKAVGRSASLENQADAPLRGRSRSWLSSKACFRDGCTGGFWRFRRCPEHLLLPSRAWTKPAHGPFTL